MIYLIVSTNYIFLDVIMTTCTKEKLVVETVKGTYILPTDDIADGRCAAEAKCTELGGILAPFTEKSEYDAVTDALMSCEYQHNLHLKYVGLNIAKDNSSRVFSNGIEFDYELHGDLYQENDVTMPDDCPSAFFIFDFDKLQIGSEWNCSEDPSRYICFKPKKNAKSEAITSDVVNTNSNLLTVGGLCLIALVCLVCFLLVKNKKLTSKIAQLTSSVA